MPINRKNLPSEKKKIETQIDNEINTAIVDDANTNDPLEPIPESDRAISDTQSSFNVQLQVTSLDEVNANVIDDDFALKEINETNLDIIKKAPVFTSVKAKQKSGITGDSGLLSIVNPEDNTKCLLIKSELIDIIKVSDEVQFGFNENEFLIMSASSKDENTFRLRKRGKNYVVYSAELVEEIANHFGLDYSEGRTCRTFGEVKYDDDFNIAYVKIK